MVIEAKWVLPVCALGESVSFLSATSRGIYVLRHLTATGRVEICAVLFMIAVWWLAVLWLHYQSWRRSLKQERLPTWWMDLVCFFLYTSLTASVSSLFGIIIDLGLAR